MTAKTRVCCLVLSRNDFTILMGPLQDMLNRQADEYKKSPSTRNLINTKLAVREETRYPSLEELEKSTIGILGTGAFGTVTLVMDYKTNNSYALKAIRKAQILELGQHNHILNEKKVMSSLDSPFLVNLLNTYKDKWKVYFLIDVCLGGELFTILRKKQSFDEPTAKFYTGCVIEAFAYMHSNDTIYRDLKPENLVGTVKGYLKVTDFGFAKVVMDTTYTLCGTPDYLAPEIVSGQGHGRGVDWWTLGILIYEMLASFPPFFDKDQLSTYRKIVKGKVRFPRYFSIPSKELIKCLLRAKPTKRLGVLRGGAQNIRDHQWYTNFSWEALTKFKMQVPIKVSVKNPEDISNFDQVAPEKEDAKPVKKEEDFDDDF